jgi:uncharacterized delta-60 repeat protein
MIAGTGLVVATSTAYAADGILDPTFGTGGKVVTSIGTGTTDEPKAMAIASDGSIFVAGYTGSPSDFAVTKYTSAGVLDQSFDTDGIVTIPVGASGDYATSIFVLPSGSILVGGYSTIGSNSDFALVKLLGTGALDPSFGSGGKVTTNFSGTLDDEARAMAVSTNGEIYLAGSTRTPGVNFGVAKYTSAGLLDTTFSGDGLLDVDFSSSADVVNTIAIHPDGSIIVAGVGGVGSDYSALAKISPTGELVTAFGVGGKVATDFINGFVSEIFAVSVSQDGDIFIAALTNSAGPTGTDIALGKLDANGQWDNTFSSDGKVLVDFFNGTDVPNSIAVVADGTVVVAGEIDATDRSKDFGLVKLLATGELDASFGSNGKVTTSFSSGNDSQVAMGITGSGSIVVAGKSSSDFAVAKYSGSTPVTTTTSTSTTSTTSTTTVTQESSVAEATTTTSTPTNPPSTTSQVATTTTTTTTVAVAKAAVLRVKKYDYTATSLARFAKMKVLKTSKASITVMKSSKKYCQVAKNRLRGLRVGQCRVTVRVKAKSGKVISKRVSLQVVKQLGK